MANATTLPQAILDRQSDSALLVAAKAAFLVLAPGFDTSENQFPHHLLEPFCILLAQAYVDIENIERRTSLSTATGADLDRLGDLYGVPRAPAGFAIASVIFTGSLGASIPQGTRVTTTGAAFQAFVTTIAAVIPPGNTIAVPVIAVNNGLAGNVGPTTITGLTSPVPLGITAVTNPAAATGGLDVEADGASGQYLLGYRADIHNLMDARGEGGAAKHLRKWARLVPGVGAALVLEAVPQPGWVTVALLQSDMTPASVLIVQAVEAALLDPWYLTFEAETLNFAGGFGASLDSQTDATPLAGTNNSILMAYNATGQGSLIQATLQSIIPQPGIWRMRVVCKRGVTVGGGNLLQFGVWNLTTGAWALTRINGSIPATTILTAAQLTQTFTSYSQDFAWNGTDALEARVFRLTSDTMTQVWVDEVNHWATMSRSDRDVGLTPAGMRLQVQSATAVPINVAGTLVYALTGGLTTGSVQASIAINIAAYLATIAFSKVPNVRRAAIEDAIYNTPGVADIQSVTLNLGTANILIPPTSVAVLGATTWS